MAAMLVACSAQNMEILYMISQTAFLQFCCFVCNGFSKHVPWLLISCITDCLCNLGSKYNGRICPGFINSKSGKQSYPQSFCNIIVDWWDFLAGKLKKSKFKTGKRF
jgi:hypothetical protein